MSIGVPVVPFTFPAADGSTGCPLVAAGSRTLTWGQDIRTSASPTFYGITLSSLLTWPNSVVFAGASGELKNGEGFYYDGSVASFGKPANAQGGSFRLESTDPVLTLRDTDGVADQNTFEIRNLSVAGSTYLQFRTVNDSKTVFTTRLAIWQSGGMYLGSSPNDPGAGNLTVSGNLTASGVVGVGGNPVGAPQRLTVVGGAIGMDNATGLLCKTTGGTYCNIFNANADDTVSYGNSTGWTSLRFFPGAAEAMRITSDLRVGFGITGPTAIVNIKAGTATANTAPLKFTSGTLLSTAEAGAFEFLTDDFYATITTGAARKGFVLNDGANLTSGKIPIASTNGRLIDGQTPLSGTKTYYVADSSGGAVTRKLTFTNGILTAET